MMKRKEKYELIPKLKEKSNGKENQDVIMLVDGSSSVSPQDFDKIKIVCKALSVRFGTSCQLGLVQFASDAKAECALTLEKGKFDAAVQAMKQLKTGTNLLAGLSVAKNQFNLTTKPKNMKQVWIITDGMYDRVDETVLFSQELKRSNTKIIGIGVGSAIDKTSLENVSSWGSVHLVANFDEALRCIENTDITVRDSNPEVGMQIVMPDSNYIKLGEDVLIEIEIQNKGLKPIEKGSRVIVKKNDYFREKSIIFTQDVPVNGSAIFPAVLQPHSRGTRSNLNQQLSNLPSCLEIAILNSQGNQIETNTVGFEIRIELFAGDIVLYEPSQQTSNKVNILVLGPAGAGKSTFINSLISSISDEIQNVNISGGKSSGITTQLLRFDLDNIVNSKNGLNFNIYDCPGVESDNYTGEELPMILDGIIPPDTNILSKDKDGAHVRLFYSHIALKRSPPEEEKKRYIHALAFFVPATASDETIERLSELYAQVTIKYKRKAVVIISHIDKVKELDKEVAIKNVCQEFRIDQSNVFTLQNYVNTKIKNFDIDKNVVNVMLAALQACNDFIVLSKATKIESPFPPHPLLSYPSVTSINPPSSSPDSNGTFQDFIDALPESQRATIKQTLVDEEITSRSILESTTDEQLRLIGLKMGQITAIRQALKAPKNNDVSRLLAMLKPEVVDKVKEAIAKSGKSSIKDLKSVSDESWRSFGLKLNAIVQLNEALSSFQQ